MPNRTLNLDPSTTSVAPAALFAHVPCRPQRPRDAALCWAAAGYAIFPCSAHKSPLTARGYRDATTDPATIMHWWRTFPDALIGLPTGEVTGLLVVDLDRKTSEDDGVASLEALQGRRQMPAHPRVATRSGGQHLYWRYPPGSDIRCSARRVGAGIDVRGAGGYVIAPPSAGYTVLVDTPLSLPPEWLLRLLAPPRRRRIVTPTDVPRQRDESWRGLRRFDALLRRAALAAEGERNLVTYWAACRAGELVLEGLLTADAAIAAVTEAATASGLDQLEAMRTATSGVTRMLQEGAQRG